MSIYKQQKEQIRTAILETAISLSREKGYDQVSIDEITKRVGIAKGTFYNFYSSKKDILMIWAAQKFQQMQADARSLADPKKTMEENMNNLVVMLCRLIDQEQTLFLIFIRELIQSNKETGSDGAFDFPSLILEIIRNSADFVKIGSRYMDIKVRVINASLFYEILNWNYSEKRGEDFRKHLESIVKVCLYGVYKDMEGLICSEG